MEKINNFIENLIDSEKFNDKLNELYTNIFKCDSIEVIDFKNDPQSQFNGIDKILYKGEKKILLEEKIRFKSYNDILLEEYSNYETRRIGWLSENKLTQILIYYVVPQNTVYVIKFKELLKFYLKYHQEWLSLYCRSYAYNKTFTTTNIAVPVEVLKELLGKNIKKFKL